MIALILTFGFYAVLATVFAVREYANGKAAQADARDARLQLETLAVVSGKNDAWLRGMITTLTEQSQAFTKDQVELVSLLTAPTTSPTPVALPASFMPEEAEDAVGVDDFDPTDRWDPPMNRVSYIAPDIPGPGE